MKNLIFEARKISYKASQLGQAVFNGDISKIKKLISKGASIEKCLSDETYEFDILYAALTLNKPEIVRYILKEKLYSSANKTYTEESESPLTLACALSDPSTALEIADSLISRGADANGTGESGGESTKYPILIAVKNNNAGLVKLLIDHGAEKDVKDKNGETPLTLAERKGYTKLANLLKGNK